MTRTGLWPTVCLAVVVLAGCGGGGENVGNERPSAPNGSIQARFVTDPREDSALIFATSDYAVGNQRLAFLLVNKKGQVLEGGTARVSIARGGLSGRPFAQRTARFERTGAPNTDTAGEDFELGGTFVVNIDFKQPGRYGLLVEPESGPFQGFALVDVKKLSASPPLGTKAPSSNNPTLVDAPAAKITTARPPDVELLRYSIRDSVESKRPFVVVFATPAFCETRACGPSVEVVDAVRARIGDRVRFIHIEVYEQNDPKRGVNQWMREWNLPTEPWIFVVDGEGTIRAKFEGLTSVRELEAAVRAIL